MHRLTTVRSFQSISAEDGRVRWTLSIMVVQSQNECSHDNSIVRKTTKSIKISLIRFESKRCDVGRIKLNIIHTSHTPKQHRPKKHTQKKNDILGEYAPHWPP